MKLFGLLRQRRRQPKPEPAPEASSLTPRADGPWHSRWPEGMRDTAHCWHVTGTTLNDLTLGCCSCEDSIMIDCPERRMLRYSLMDGPHQVAIGRGFLLCSCPSGERRIALDGYGVSYTLTPDDEDPAMKKAGLEGAGLAKWPQGERS